jgi:murein DD-endopeptidase MepM/ murein hydrolase activator NlpD
MEAIFITKTFYTSLFSLILLVFLISIFFIPTFNSNLLTTNTDYEILQINPDGYVWPIPGYTTISSSFGKRVSPTTGASSSHSGIDIPAPPGTKFIAIADGEITFCQFLGAGGYTITLSFSNYKVSYCHCDPNFIVKVGDKIKQGQVIGYVGPKNVYGVKGNIYFDSDRKSNKWSHYWAPFTSWY